MLVGSKLAAIAIEPDIGPRRGGRLRRRSRGKSIYTIDLENVAGSDIITHATISHDKDGEQVNRSEEPQGTNSPRSSISRERRQSNESAGPDALHLFHAFPEARWFNSKAFAIGGFVIMTVMVLGNLIYT
jgi:hypothetical protein